MCTQTQTKFACDHVKTVRTRCQQSLKKSCSQMGMDAKINEKCRNYVLTILTIEGKCIENGHRGVDSCEKFVPYNPNWLWRQNHYLKIEKDKADALKKAQDAAALEGGVPAGQEPTKYEKVFYGAAKHVKEEWN